MTEEQLMSAVKNGDLEKAGQLFEIYHKRIYNFFFRLCFDREKSEDMTQNVFIRIIKYRSSYNPASKFRSWIYQIARNQFYDTVKKESATRTEEISDAVMMKSYEEESENHVVLKMSLKQLNDEDRQLLVLSKYENMKYKEIATIMDISVGNVKVKVHRALHKLRNHYFELERR